ncbi:DUF58 domain-containing protein [Paenibacillus glycanilyticus]|uniref:DUF58 domain-containing protein n=1 Tax=Paenibacillus glycanilyticus TaxID=126569 RepID=A0ABQ6NWY2_9BACL|nr:DUF58 domain-containing protein [Paenibacillus glycanilyticus]GMK48479.1 hypothetical protein PghCCS26_56090 [Paenibacillus glycanilyticus]
MNAVKETKTRKRWRLIAIIYGAALLYLLFQGGKTALMLFMILNVLLIYLALGRWSGISRVSGIRSYRQTGASAGSDHSLTAGSTLDVQLSVKVPGVYPIPYVLVRDRLQRHNGQQLQFEASFVPSFKRSGDVLYQTPPLQRGEYRFVTTECISHDIFGLFEHSGRFGSESAFSVLPQIVPLRQWHSIQSGFRGPFSHAAAPRAAKETTQINGVREYLYGDRLSRIHWNATAKTGDWKSKAFERESLPRTLIILDRYAGDYPAPGTERFELAVSTAASLIDSGLKGDTAIGIMSAGKKLTILPPKSGVEQRNALMKHLTFVDADAEQGLYKSLVAADSRLEPGSFAIVISGTSGREAIRSMEWLSRKGLTPCLMHIGGDRRLEEQWRLMIRGKGWSLFELKQLQELPAVLEGGRA